MSAKIKRVKLNDIGTIELLNASFKEHSFKKHFHEEFCFGVVSSGQLDFNYRGEKISATKGLINLCNPGEIHDGFSSEGWAYKMFYVNPKLMAQLSSSISGKINDIPFFKEGVIFDEYLALKLDKLNDTMFNQKSFTIEKEQEFIEVVSLFIKRHADSFIPIEKLISSKELIKNSLEYINDNLQYDITVSKLSQMANLSLYYYIRIFKKEIGLTPKDYLIQQRIKKAKELILKKYPLSQVALMSGFYDQSHMLKYFKSYIGVNPSSF